MAIGLRLLAKLNAPSPEPERLLSDIADWLRQKYPEVLPQVTRGKEQGRAAIFCRLHPGAEPVELLLTDAEHLVVSASTSAAGPGYHIFLVSLLKDFAHDFHTSWQRSEDDSEEYDDETGYFFSGDEQQVFSHMTSWLQSVAGLFFDGSLDPDSTAVALSMSPQTIFESDQLAVTPLGPRGRDWMRQTSMDGARGKDFFAWWTPGLNAGYYLGRALALMWSTVRWRPPVSEAETEVLKTVSTSLTQAYKLDPKLAYPWTEWGEVVKLLGPNLPQKDRVVAQAGGTSTIGYRRGKVTETLTGGWRIRIPGSFSEFDFDQDNNFFAVDPPRGIWFTSFRLPAPLSDEKFEAVKLQLKESNSEFHEEGLHYAATATAGKNVRATGEEYYLLNTLNVSPTAKAVCSIVYPLTEEKDWALEAWKSLRPPADRNP